MFLILFGVELSCNRKSQWKIDFLTIFLLFSRVPEAVGEFFASYFFPFAVWGGDFSGWCGIQAGWGRVSPPVSWSADQAIIPAFGFRSFVL